MALAQRERAGLLVVGVPDHSGNAGRLLGNVHLALAGTSPCLVVVVPPSVDDLPRAMGPIVCGVDGSDQAVAAAGVAVELGRRLELPVQLVHVTDRPRLASGPGDERDYATRLLAAHGGAMRVLLRTVSLPQAALDLRVELGGPAERLAEVAAREGAPLIVNGVAGMRVRPLGPAGLGLLGARAHAAQPLVLVPRADGAGHPDRAYRRTPRARQGEPIAGRRRKLAA